MIVILAEVGGLTFEEIAVLLAVKYWRTYGYGLDPRREAKRPKILTKRT